ncbi:ABC transporter permease [Bacillus marasmi]|uniref:ABC transporter permease n=1 Tax=Bacillus marasmi TaxID=1926279 RepID=UPI0011C89E80|nr:ABC transporter permease [Bacillus marasmi]
MKNVYLKSSFREIKSSKGKFISIIIIILLGTLIFVGVRSTGPDLSNSASTYVNKYDLYDLQIVSTMGLTEDDLQVLKEEKGLVVEAGFQATLEKNKDEILQILSFSKDSDLNKLRVVEGKLPDSTNEIVLDVKAKELGYKLGDTYKLNSPSIKDKSFKIVGFAYSPLYISKSDRGSTNNGSGNISYFGYLPEENFYQEVYSQLFIKFSNTDNLVANSSEYSNVLDENVIKIEKLFASRPQERLNEIQSNTTETINTNLQEITVAKEQIEAAKMHPGVDLTTLNEEISKLDSVENELETQLSEVELMEKPVYYFNTRSSIPGYQDYFDSATSIAAIASVFPAFFLFIAVLVTFTTMSRMVEENRGEIGTLKALGYSKVEIAQKYIIYTLLAGLLGVGLGTIIGTKTLPPFIFNILKDYNIPTFVGEYHWNYIIPALIAGLFATLGSALYVLWKDLREKPAMLMRPRAPKSGKRIFLERISPIWRRISFNQKVSYRNLFRYKSRMIMAIVGIAGCTGLILAGYGIKNSTDDLKPKQFNEILHYQAIVTMDQVKTLTNHSLIKDDMNAIVESLSVENEKSVSQTVSMISPSDVNNFNQYVTLRDVNNDGMEFTLPKSGVVITEKLADDMNVETGDTLYIKRGNKKIKFTIKAIAKNYLGHFIYITPSYYEELFEEGFNPTSVLIKTEKMSAAEQKSLTSSLLENDEVKNVSFFEESGGVEQFGSLNSVVIILIVLSGALALVVLYNLTNINISERIRELSTIKVLGFYNKEVTAYVMRENILLSVMGIFVGFFVGTYLHRFILTTAESGNIVFPLEIHLESFVYSGIITMVFNLLVIAIAHFKLKHINMIDALKSNE